MEIIPSNVPSVKGPTQGDINRLWPKVKKDCPNGCWEWTGSKRPQGYGRFRFNNRVTAAHRFSYELIHGVIPDSMEIDHICLNKSCVNPAHLRIATHSDNQKNRPCRKDNKSGRKGIIWHKAAGKWRAAITSNKVTTVIGYCDDIEIADAAYQDAATRIHGAFAYVGKAS